MKIAGEFNYRNARAILSATHEGLVDEVVSILGTLAAAVDRGAASEDARRCVLAPDIGYCTSSSPLPRRVLN